MPYETAPPKNLSAISRGMLRWYDFHARDLPWRIGPKARKQGKRPDPYHVWLSEIMLQQTTVATVAPRYAEFLERWPTVSAIAAAPVDDILGQWAGLGYYARARNLHKCAVVVCRDHSGIFPDTEDALQMLPGIGEYTAAAIAAIAFDRHAVVVDGNIERVVSRLFAIDTPLPTAKTEMRSRAADIWPAKRSGDFAQGLMDLGSAICRPRSPRCSDCPISSACEAFAKDAQEEFPKKAKKKAKRKRHGAVFALFNSKGEILFERRPDNGLLGGMQGLPGTQWAEKLSGDLFADAPLEISWDEVGEITHVFTHFHLTLVVYIAQVPKGFRRQPGRQWIAPAKVSLPTVMKKAVELAVNKIGSSE